MPAPARIALALAVVGLVVFLDARSKGWAARELRAIGPRTVAGGHLRLQYVQNTGIAFGRWSEGNRAALIARSATVSVTLAALLIWMMRIRGLSPILPAGVVLMLAGALGNMLDRITRGFVVDFIGVT